MAHFKAVLPNEVFADVHALAGGCDEMINQMVIAGAEVVKENVYKRMPDGLKKYANSETLHVTKPYKMPKMGATACSIWFGGYKKEIDGKDHSKDDDHGTALELIANMFEYGSKHRNYPKQPFLRRSFHKREIERAMLKAQKKFIKEGSEAR